MLHLCGTGGPGRFASSRIILGFGLLGSQRVRTDDSSRHDQPMPGRMVEMRGPERLPGGVGI